MQVLENHEQYLRAYMDAAARKDCFGKPSSWKLTKKDAEAAISRHAADCTELLPMPCRALWLLAEVEAHVEDVARREGERGAVALLRAG